MDNEYVEILAAQEEAVRRGLLDPVIYACRQWPMLMSPDGTILLDKFQVDIIRSIFTHQEVRIKGCTKAGKGAATGIAINLWFKLFDTARIVVTSQKFEHAKNNIFGAEVVHWRKKMVWPGGGEIMTAGIYDNEKHNLIIANPKITEGFSGQHSSHGLFVFDESTGVSVDFYSQALTQARCIVALSNPRTMVGWFRAGFPKSNPDKTQTVVENGRKKRLITVSGESLRNVVEGKEVIPNQMGRELYEALSKNPNKRWVEVFMKGKFPSEDPEAQIIFLSWLDWHHNAYDDTAEVEGFGLDVAASEDGDDSVLTAGGMNGIRRLHTWQHKNTMRSVDAVIAIAHDVHGIDLTKGRVPIGVDMDGVGVGVGDRLQDMGCWVVAVRGSATAQNKTLYANVRAENYGEMGRRLDPTNEYGIPFQLPHDDLLDEELTAPLKVYSPDGVQFRITPKDRHPGLDDNVQTIRDLIGRSPDRADSAVYMYKVVRENQARIATPKRNLTCYPAPKEEERLDVSAFARELGII